MPSIFDTAVVGAGVFGSWIALHLAKRGQRVLLLEAHGPAHSRASSGGESRIIRMSYGPDEIYTRWSQNSLRQWKELFAAASENLFHQTGVLWLSSENDATLIASHTVLTRNEINHQLFERQQLEHLYPQVNFDGVSRGLFEPESGVLLARRAVAATVQAATRHGVQFRIAQIQAPQASQMLLAHIETATGERISAGNFVFACGPWLGKLFPEILGARIFPTRQEVFFFATPPGDTRFAPPALPTWLFQADEVYGMPDVESRGLKIACDTHGAQIDPDTQSRLVSSEGAAWARSFVARRFPALAQAPIVETRVCQYENTSNGDFLIDRHPQFSNVWFAGGGSGHGFKHGPAVGEYTASVILGEATPEPRFALASKATQQNRTVH
ncbi:MAG TPA: N-methyl-L-tryptophan oxidase [Candidatus Sulfotelmatobacter sp.]|nr:N-methyl-L-tryptophan oxidase [Candidatus Sulfotelmatobacter sp.]